MKSLPVIAFAGTLAGLGGYKMWAVSKLDGRPTEKIPHNISIVLPSLNEAANIQDTLESLRMQTLFTCDCRNGNRSDEIIVVDSGSNDRTVDIAKVYGCRVIENVPRGKLTARNIGTTKASGDIIVSCDCDTIYPPNWLFLITRHFNNPKVVAVSGATYFNGKTYAMYLRAVANILGQGLMFMQGQNSAFRKDVFLDVCELNENINQQNIWSVWMEEEWGFPRRLAQHGKFVFDHQAVAFTSPRRYQCVPKEGYCSEISGIYGEREMALRMNVRQ